MKIKYIISLLLIVASIITVIAVVFFGWTDKAGIYMSLGLFVVSSISLYYLTEDSKAVSQLIQKFEDIIIGSVGVGLSTIKKLQDHPPEKIANTTSSKFQFVGISGRKFLKNIFEKNDFFKTNREPLNIQIILMDPFSNDMLGLDGENRMIRSDIIKSITYLNEMRYKGYKFEVRLYPRVPPLRLMICDGKDVAISMYTPNSNGWQNAQLIFKKTSEYNDTSLAPHFSSLFIDMWDKSINFSLELRANALEVLTNKNHRTKITNTNDDLPKYGMVHGRFQPLHHEHLEYILWGINNSKKCFIGITQPDINNLSETIGDKHRKEESGNPFSFDERKIMIEESLKDFGISEERFEVVRFDVDNFDVAMEYLQKEYGIDSSNTIQYMKIFSNWEDWKKDKFKSKEFKVIEIHEKTKEKAEKHITGTLVRELIRTNRNWQDYTSSGTERVISNIHSSVV